MDKVINLGIPHVAELIFESIDTPGLINCMEVSETWRELAENVLIKRWKGKMLEACKNGETKVVQLLLENCTSEESGLNAKDCPESDEEEEDDEDEDDEDDEAEDDDWEDVDDDEEDVDDDEEDEDENEEDEDDDEEYEDIDEDEDVEAEEEEREYGLTPFIWACKNGHRDVVQLLLDHSERIDMNARSNGG